MSGPLRAAFLTCAVLALLAGSTLLGGGGEANAQRSSRPNVVVVMTDDQDVRSLSVMRGVRQLLADRGTTFTNSFATFPLCCPSRATFLTGQYAHNHGVQDNEPPGGGYPAFEDTGTLPVSLRAAGYRTGYVGKYLNGYGTTRVPPGWNGWYTLMRLPNRMFGYTLNQNGRPQRFGSRARDYQTDVLARKATGFIDRASRGRKPFFLTLATGAPHSETKRPPGSLNPRPAPRHRHRFRKTPLPHPPSFNEADVSDKPAFVRNRPLLGAQKQRAFAGRHRGRLGSLLAVDEAVRRVIAELKQAGELANTVIVFTSDNGYLLGEHRLMDKTELYEESARVPLIVRGPGIPRGVRRPQITGNIDLAPTILDVTGAQPRRVMDGRSLIPLARSPAAASGRDILLENRRSAAVRTSRYMYAEHPSGETELYDLRADPSQLESRHDDPQLGFTRLLLEQRLRELEGCAGATCR